MENTLVSTLIPGQLITKEKIINVIEEAICNKAARPHVLHTKSKTDKW